MNSFSRQVRELLWLLPAIVVGVPLRLYHLTDVSYWFDESFCIKMAAYEIPDLLSRARNDPHPPLFYFVLKAWISVFGSSMLSTRSLGVFLGTIAIVVTFYLVRESYADASDTQQDRRALWTAALAALFIALSPAQIRWSQLLRMYSLLTALAAVSSYFLMRATRRPSGTLLDWCMFTGSVIALVYTHYFGLFLAAAQFIFIFGIAAWARKGFVAVSASALSVFLCFLPWLVPLLQHRNMVASEFDIPPLTWEMAGSTLHSAFDLNLWQAFTPNMGLLIMQLCFLIPCLTFLQGRAADAYLSLAAAIPLLIATIISLLMRHLFVDRYFLAIQMFYLICFARLLGCLPTIAMKGSAGMLAVFGLGYLTMNKLEEREYHSRLPGMQAAIRFWEAHREPDAILVVCNPMMYMPAIDHSHAPQEIYVAGSSGNYPFYHGTAVMRDEEYLSTTAIAELKHDVIWVLDAGEWRGEWGKTILPCVWQENQSFYFPDFNAVLALRRLVREEGTECLNELNQNP